MLLPVSTLAAPAAAHAQETTVGDSLARELVEVILSGDQFERMLDGMVGNAVQAYTAQFAAVEWETEAERAEFARLLRESEQRYSYRLREFYQDSLDLQSLTYRISVPLYAKYFSEQELRELLTFYATPVGQKVIVRLPELLTESMRETMGAITAPLTEFAQRTIEQEAQTVMAGMEKFRKTKKIPTR
jgi:hypothetical protein